MSTVAKNVESVADANVELRRSFGWRTGAATAGLLSTFLLTVVALRTLPATDAAALFAVLAALAIGPLLGRLGLGPNVIRLLPGEPDPDRRRVIAGTHLMATLLLSGVTAPFVAIIATTGLLGRSDHVAVAVLTAGLIIVESARLTLSDIYAATGRVRASVATTHHIRSTLALPLVAIVVLLSDRPSIIAVLVTYSAVALVQFLIALWCARPQVAFRGAHGVAALRTAIGTGSKLFSLDLAAFLTLPGTVWLANIAFDPDAAARYSAVATLAAQVTVLESLASLAVTPAAARMWAAGERTAVTRILSAVATLSTCATAAIVGLLALCGSALLNLAYGPPMADAGALLVVLAAGGIAKTAFGVNVSLLIISGHVNEASRVALGIIVLAVPAGVVAAYYGGPPALAGAAAGATTALAVAQWLIARRVVPPAPRASFRLTDAWRELLGKVAAQ